MKNILIISEVYKKGGAGNATNNIFEFFNKNFNNVNLLIPLKKIQSKIYTLIIITFLLFRICYLSLLIEFYLSF